MSHGSDGGGAMRTPGGGRARRRLSDGGSEGSTPASLGYRRGRGGSGKKQGRSGRGLTPGTQVGVGVSVGSGAGHRLRLPIVPRHATPSLDIGVVNSRPGTAPSVRRHITTAREYHAEGAGASIHAQHQPFRGPWRARRTQVYDGTEDNNLSPDEAQSDDSGSGRQHRMGACRQRKGGDGNVSGEEAGSGLAQGLSPGRAGSCGAFGEGLEAALEDSISSERDSGQLQRRRCVWQRRRRQAHAVGEDDDELADVACVDAAGGGMEASNGSEGSRGLAAEGLLPSPAEAVPHVGRRRLRRALVNDEDGDMHGTTAGGEPPPLPTAEAHQIAAAVPIKIKLFRPCAAQGGPTHPPHRTCQPADPSSRSPSPVPIPRRPFTGRELGLRTGGSGAVGTGASGGSSTPGAGAGLGTGAGPGPGAGGSHGLKLRLKLPVGPSGGTQLPEERVSLRDVAVIPRGTIAAHAPRPTAIIALTSFPQPVQQHTGDLTPVGHGPMPASLRELEPRIPNAELQAEVSTYGANATVGLECNAASEAIPQLDGAGDLDEDSYDVMGSGRTSNSAPDGCHQSPPAASMSLSARLRHNLRSDLFPSARGAGGEACAAFLSALEPTSPRTAGVLTSSLSRIPGGSPKAIDLDGPADTGPSPTSLLSFPPTQLQQQQPQQSTQMLQPDTAITAFLPQQQPARPGHLSILQKLPPEPSAGAVPPLSSPSGHHPQNLHMPTSATQDYPWQQSDVVSREAQVRIPQALASPEAATPFLFNQPQQQPQPNQFQSLQEMNRANILAVPAAGGPAAPASLQAIASAGRTLAPASEPAAQQDTCNKAFQRRLPMPASEAVVAAAEHQGQHSNVALGQVHAGSTRSVAAAPSLQPLPQVRQTGENAGSDAAAEAGAMEIAGAAPGAALGPSSAPQFVSPASPGLDGSSAVPAALPSTGRGAGISPPALLVPPPPRSVSGGGAAVPAKRGADGAAKAAPVRPGPGRPHVVKSISEAVPDAQKAVGLMPLGAHRTAQQSVATPKGSLSRMIPGRQGQQQRTPPSGLLAAAKQQQVATPTGLAGSRPVAGLAAAANAGMGRTLGARVPGADGGGASPTAGVVTRSTAGPQFAGGSGGGLNGMASRPPHPHPALQQGESMVLGSVSGTASGLVQAPSKVSTPVSVPLAQAPHQQHATPDGATAIQLAIRTAIAGTLQRYDMPPPSNTPTTMLTAAAAAPPLLPTAASPSVSAVAIIGSAISAGSAAPPAPKQRLPLPRLLSPWEIRDIPLLVTALRRGLAESPYHDDVPFTVRDPEHALEQLEEALTVLEHPAFAAAPTGPALLAPSADCTLMASGALATAGASGDVEGVGVGPSVSGMPMGPPPRPLPLAARAPPAVAAASSRAAPYPTIRFASDAELPPVWRQLRDRLAAQRAQSPGPGSTAIGTTLDGDTVEQIAETDPAASAGVGGPGGPGGGRHHPQRSAGRAGAAQPVSKKMAKLRKGLGLS
ncbi:hypothetical protein Vretifemale_14164 [Volvox reticuliferus]|uniref:Uncharacterized protein n=1 Tax=Volvox reticuliferus TaxID=1737510 RepID=A0A8J4FQ68_9CHLO|nr:hypothetical protein Vretifemale_14164 [Volvox reticuliferus]